MEMYMGSVLRIQSREELLSVHQSATPTSFAASLNIIYLPLYPPPFRILLVLGPATDVLASANGGTIREVGVVVPIPSSLLGVVNDVIGGAVIVVTSTMGWTSLRAVIP